MTRPGDVYRRAARWLETQPPHHYTGMCEAVLRAGGTLAQAEAIGVFKPDCLSSPWWGTQWSDDLAERRGAR